MVCTCKSHASPLARIIDVHVIVRIRVDCFCTSPIHQRGYKTLQCRAAWASTETCTVRFERCGYTLCVPPQRPECEPQLWLRVRAHTEREKRWRKVAKVSVECCARCSVFPTMEVCRRGKTGQKLVHTRCVSSQLISA
jgi:hypothetical protein